MGAATQHRLRPRAWVAALSLGCCSHVGVPGVAQTHLPAAKHPAELVLRIGAAGLELWDRYTAAQVLGLAHAGNMDCAAAWPG